MMIDVKLPTIGGDFDLCLQKRNFLEFPETFFGAETRIVPPVSSFRTLTKYKYKYNTKWTEMAERRHITYYNLTKGT